MDQQREMPLFPLNTVLFPGMALPLHIFEERYKAMINECIHDSHPFGIVLIKSGQEVGDDTTIYDVGTTAHITSVERFKDGRLNVATLGFNRFRIHSTHRNKPYLTGIVEDFPLADTTNPRAKLLSIRISLMLKAYLDIFATLGKVELEVGAFPEDPVILAFLTAIVLRMPMRDKQQLLTAPDLLSLLRTERKMLYREIHLLKLMIENGPRWRDDSKPFSVN